MKVLYTINDLHFGGASNVLLNTLPALARKIDLDLVYYAGKTDMKERFEEAGLRPQRIPYRGKIDYFKAVRSTKNLVREGKYDLVHSNLMMDKFIAGPAGTWAGKPVVATLHSALNPYRDPHLPRLQRFKNKLEDVVTHRLMTACIAVSEATARNWIEHRGLSSDQVRPIHTGVSPAEPTGELDEEIIAFANRFEKVLLTACRLHRVKGLDRLIRVLKSVVEQGIDAGLIILGEGGFRSKAEPLIEELELGDRVLLPGYRERVQGYMKHADYYVNASHSEAFPVSILEAMQLGLPALASGVGGIPEIIEDGVNGFLIDFKNDSESVNTFVRALRLEEPAFRSLQERTKAEFKKRFTMERYVDELLKFYNHTIKN